MCQRLAPQLVVFPGRATPKTGATQSRNITSISAVCLGNHARGFQTWQISDLCSLQNYHCHLPNGQEMRFFTHYD